jgi:hypothetical protein
LDRPYDDLRHDADTCTAMPSGRHMGVLMQQTYYRYTALLLLICGVSLTS